MHRSSTSERSTTSLEKRATLESLSSKSTLESLSRSTGLDGSSLEDEAFSPSALSQTRFSRCCMNLQIIFPMTPPRFSSRGGSSSSWTSLGANLTSCASSDSGVLLCRQHSRSYHVITLKKHYHQQLHNIISTPDLTNRSLERESQSTGFLFLDPLVSEKLPSLKGSNATYNQNRWPFDTDTFVNLSLSGFWKIPSLQSTVPLFSRCTRGMLRRDY